MEETFLSDTHLLSKQTGGRPENFEGILLEDFDNRFRDSKVRVAIQHTETSESLETGVLMDVVRW